MSAYEVPPQVMPAEEARATLALYSTNEITDVHLATQLYISMVPLAQIDQTCDHDSTEALLLDRIEYDTCMEMWGRLREVARKHGVAVRQRGDKV